MKKYIFSMLCVVSTAQGMEVAQVRIPQRWDAQKYIHGCKNQELTTLQALQESGINLKNKTVLDIGCGPGHISAKIAEQAKRVHGIDACDDMIYHAQINYFVPDFLTFEHIFAEDFDADDTYDIAVCFFCLQWIKNKSAVLKRVNHALPVNGDFFGTIKSTSIPETPFLDTFSELIPNILTAFPFLKRSDFRINQNDSFVISDEEFKNLLLQNGFEIVSYQQKSLTVHMDKEEIASGMQLLLTENSFMAIMSDVQKTEFFNYCTEEFVKKLHAATEEENKYIMPDIVCTKVFHARKIAKLN